ncbi:aldo/keto reductase [candidate division GN15 bacterium]|nr:aldo/keto reductase [candidate division GN15 bacterium]
MISRLDQYRLLGHSGLRVSPLCLGTMTFGTEWGWGADKDVCRKMFDRYAEAGGNFIDTANVYTNGTSEQFVGEFVKGQREKYVIATKYTSCMNPGDPNAGGNHRKNLVQAVEASLKRLQTDYIDLYWVHAWDNLTPVEEVMRGLDDLVRQGKILYVGVSDTPAWVIAQANTLARFRGWTPFTVMQVHYNLVERTVERELVPMGEALGVAVQPWSPLAGGVLAGKYDKSDLTSNESAEQKSGRAAMNKQFGMLTERALEIVEVVKQVAEELGRTPSQVSLRWLLQKPGVVSPIIGARTMAHFEDNLGCLEFELSPEQMARLDEAGAIEPGFPHDFLGSDQIRQVVFGGATIVGSHATLRG